MEKVTRYYTIKLVSTDDELIRKELSDILNLEMPTLGIEHKGAETHIVLSASGETEDEAKQIIKPVAKEIKKRFGDRIYSTKEKETIEMAVVRLLEKHELSVATAESCTGGLLAGRFINVPGVSEVFKEGFITYTNKAKRKTLDVSKSTLKKYGAVSRQTAKEMVTGAIFASGADTALAVTGIAGPDGGTPEKPVGLVYIACYLHDKVSVEEFRFNGNRMEIREQSVTAALDMLRKCILESTH